MTGKTKTTKTEGTPVDKTFEAWQTMFDQNIDRLDAVYEEIEKRQVQAVEQTNRAIGEIFKVTQDTMSFGNQLSQEWLRTARGTSRWASKMMGFWLEGRVG